MGKRTNHILLALSDRRVQSASGTWSLQTPWRDQDPVALGEALRGWLDEHQLGRGACVVGLPASWVVTRHMVVPTTKPPLVDAAVRVRVAREFAAGTSGYMLDYCTKEVDGQSRVVVAAAAKTTMQHLQATLDAAGLKLERAIITDLAVAASAIDRPSGPLLTVSLDGVAVVTSDEGVWSGVMDLDADAQDAGEVDMALAGLPSAEGLKVALVARAGDAETTKLAQGLDRTLDHTVDPIQALRTATKRNGCPDLARDRLSKVQKHRPKWWRYAAYGVAAVLLLGAWLGWEFYSRAQQIEDLEFEVSLVAPEAERVRELREKVETTEPWFDERVDVIACLEALGQTIPRDGRVWLSNFRGGDARGMTVEGFADSRESMLAYIDRMQDDPRLSGVELQGWSSFGRSGRAVRFEFKFQYEAEEGGGDVQT